MSEDSRRSGREGASCAGGVRNAKGTSCGQGSGHEKDKTPPAPQMSVRNRPLFSDPGKRNVLRSVARNRAERPVALERAGDIPAWALRQNCPARSCPTPGEGIVSPSSSPPLRPLMTVGEAATILHVSTRTIRRLIERGELQKVRIGRSIRIRTEDVAGLISDHPND